MTSQLHMFKLTLENLQVTLVDSVLYTVLKESGQTLTESVFI